MNPAQLPDRAEIVIIGGGIIGCSTAYHLAKEGKRDVILLERSELTSGTTWHSSAMVRQLRSSQSLTMLAKYSAELYQRLPAETEQSTGWIGCGSVSIATNSDRLEHIRRQASLARVHGIKVEEVGPEDIARLWPIANTEDILGGILSHGDGRVGPSDLCSALVKGAKADGVRIFEHTPVNGFEFANGRIAGVRIEGRTIACETVVLCAGLWSRELARLAGASVPLQACEHYSLITHSFDGIYNGMPILGDHDNHMYIRDEGGGLLVGCFEPNARAVELSQLPENFSFDLLEENWDHFEPIIDGAIHRIPALRDAEVKMLLNGPESFTLDNNFILGEAPETPGLFMCCGMNSVGVASGGGAGRALAEWIVAGEPTMDLTSVDARRFPRLRNSLCDLRARAPEVLSKHYLLHRLGNEWQSGRPGRMTPLHDRHSARGARFGDRAGWERALWFDPDRRSTPYEPSFSRPPWYDHVLEEQMAARTGVALFDQSQLGKILIQGRDAESFLERICAARMAIGLNRVQYVPVLNGRGGFDSEWIVLRLGREHYMILTGSAQATRDLHMIGKRRQPDELVTATDVTGALSVLSVMGPKSRDLLAGLTTEDLSDVGFPFYTHREIEVAGVIVRAVRVSYVGELGWELHVPVETARTLYDRLIEAGEPAGLRDAGAYALDALRLEKGICSWGHDIGPDDTPLEARLSFSLKLDTDIPFIGREALERQKADGIGRSRILIAADDPEVMLLGGEPIVLDGEIVGQTTSGAYAALSGRAVAMGFVRTNGRTIRSLLETARVEVEVALHQHGARAALKSLIPTDAKRLRAAE